MNTDQTSETCDSGEPSRASLFGSFSGKYISDDSLRNALSPDSFPNLSAVLLLYSGLADAVMKLSNIFFNSIERHSRSKGFLLKAEKTSRKGEKLGVYQKRVLLAKAVRKMLFNGELKLIQRPFWVWKMIMPQKRTLRAQSVIPDTGVVIRRLVNRIGTFVKINQLVALYDVRVFARTSKTRKTKRYNACLVALQKILKRPLRKYFFATADLRFNKVKSNLMNLNAFFMKILINAFKNWQNYYPEVCQEDGYEPLNHVSLQLKNFYMMKKPCVPYYFYDIHTYDPAFQATFHALNHFMKRKLRKALKLWSGSSYRRNSFDSINSLSSDSKINYSLFKLTHSSSEKLQTILSALLQIHQKRSEMSKAFLSKWSENSTLNNLKLSRLKLVLLSQSKQMQRKKLFFNRFRESSSKLVEFTDLYK